MAYARDGDKMVRSRDMKEQRVNSVVSICLTRIGENIAIGERLVS
jgi:hypothetical protein